MKRPIRSRLGLALAAALTVISVAACNPGAGGSTSAPAGGGGSAAPASVKPAASPAASAGGGYTY
jgi:hypothetical protein